MKHFYFIVFMLICSLGFSQQLKYTPVNPAFGGNTFNYQWLLSSAQAQNSFEDPNAVGREELSELDRLTESLNRQLFSQIGRSLFTDQFGESLTPGTFNFGNLALEIFDSSGGLVINILDITTGEQTQIIVPNQ